MGTIVEPALNIRHLRMPHSHVPNERRFFAIERMPFLPVLHCRRQAITALPEHMRPRRRGKIPEWASVLTKIAVHLSGRFPASKPLENRNEVQHDEVCTDITLRDSSSSSISLTVAAESFLRKSSSSLSRSFISATLSRLTLNRGVPSSRPISCAIQDFPRWSIASSACRRSFARVPI